MIPERVRVNMRYRGPKESIKMSRITKEASLNLTRVEATLTMLQTRLQQYSQGIHQGKEGEGAFDKTIRERTERVTRRIQNLERGVGNG